MRSVFLGIPPKTAIALGAIFTFFALVIFMGLCYSGSQMSGIDIVIRSPGLSAADFVLFVSGVSLITIGSR